MLQLVRIKACRRCGGDISLECDIYGVYAECIQCGATWYQKVPKLRIINSEEMSFNKKESTPKTTSAKQ
jgi:hypothetical protein